MKNKLFKLLIIFQFSFIATRAQENTKTTLAFRKSYEFEATANYSAAAKELELLSEKSYEVNLRLGWLNYLQKKYPASVVFYKQAINQASKSIEARLGLIYPLTAMENWDELMNLYKEIIQIDPHHTKANYWLASGYFLRKEYSPAAEHAQRILNLYPFDYDTNLLMGKILLTRGKMDEAKKFYQRALYFNPSNKELEDLISKL